jgi:hypothetical protein
MLCKVRQNQIDKGLMLFLSVWKTGPNTNMSTITRTYTCMHNMFPKVQLLEEIKEGRKEKRMIENEQN